MWTFVFLSLFLWEFGSSFTVEDCPDNIPRDEYLTVFDNKCYCFYLNVQKDHGDAQQVCGQNGGNLAAVKTPRINNFIWRNLKDKYNFNGDVWIGLTDEDDEGEYEWRDGSRMVYENFKDDTGPDTPWYDISNKYQDCVALGASRGKWRDFKCGDTDYLVTTVKNRESFVCEYSPKPRSVNTNGVPVRKDDCPPSLPRNKNLQVLGQTCYYFYLHSKMTFQSARDSCKKHGGDLASIKTEKVQNFIWKTLKLIDESKGSVWIGLSDVEIEDAFVWTDGSLVDYGNFDENAKLFLFHFFHDCVLLSYKTGKWLDAFCGEFKDFICEFPATPRTRTPSTTPTTTTTTTTEQPSKRTTTLSTPTTLNTMAVSNTTSLTSTIVSRNTPDTNTSMAVETKPRTKVTLQKTTTTSSKITSNPQTTIKLPSSTTMMTASPGTTTEITADQNTAANITETPSTKPTPDQNTKDMTNQTTSTKPTPDQNTKDMTNQTPSTKPTTVQNTKDMTNQTPSTKLTTTDVTSSTEKTTCPPLDCRLDCQMEGYIRLNGCPICQCQQ